MQQLSTSKLKPSNEPKQRKSGFPFFTKLSPFIEKGTIGKPKVKKKKNLVDPLLEAL